MNKGDMSVEDLRWSIEVMNLSLNLSNDTSTADLSRAELLTLLLKLEKKQWGRSQQTYGAFKARMMRLG